MCVCVCVCVICVLYGFTLDHSTCQLAVCWFFCRAALSMSSYIISIHSTHHNIGEDVYASRIIKKGQVVLRDSPLVTASKSHFIHHNDRFAWNMVEVLLKSSMNNENTDALQTILNGKFARGLGEQNWEEPGMCMYMSVCMSVSMSMYIYILM